MEIEGPFKIKSYSTHFTLDLAEDPYVVLPACPYPISALEVLRWASGAAPGAVADGLLRLLASRGVGLCGDRRDGKGSGQRALAAPRRTVSALAPQSGPLRTAPASWLSHPGSSPR